MKINSVPIFKRLKMGDGAMIRPAIVAMVTGELAIREGEGRYYRVNRHLLLINLYLIEIVIEWNWESEISHKEYWERANAWSQ